MNKEAKLTNVQSEILVILYKFRFATRELIAGYIEVKTVTYLHHALKKLLEQGYIARRYTGKDKLAGKPAIYYLSNEGIKYLARNPDLNTKVLNLIYKDKYASNQFIEDNLTIFKLYLDYRDKYKDKVDFYTKSETKEYPYFLKPNPYAYITFDDEHMAEYFIELITVKTPYFAIKRRINQYIKHYQSDIWREQTQKDYPITVLLVDDHNLKNRLQKTIDTALVNQDITGLKFEFRLVF